METSQFNDALARLDAEIEATERALADLRLKRTGAEAFLAYMTGGPATTKAASPTLHAVPAAELAASSVKVAATAREVASNGGSPTEAVWQTILASQEDLHTIDEVWTETRADGNDLTRDQVKNAIHYLVRKHQLTAVRRGLWEVATDPAASGETEAAETGTSGLGGENTHAQAEADHDRRALDGDDVDDRGRGASIVQF